MEQASTALTSSPESSSWTPEGLAVLERAVAHYGGFAAWHRLRKIRLIPDRLSGFVPWVKGVGRTFPLPSLFELEPKDRVARFIGYPDAASVGIFRNGAVRIERLADGTLLADGGSHRASFAGLAKYRRWSPLDALYFFGYALTHYHSLPFSLRAARLLRVGASGAGDRHRDFLELELPADVPTHSRWQRFYFDREGCLTRHDYHAEIVGFWARGAHSWNRQVSFGGFPIALERHVVARIGAATLPMVALRATFLSAEVELDGLGT